MIKKLGSSNFLTRGIFFWKKKNKTQQQNQLSVVLWRDLYQAKVPDVL